MKGHREDKRRTRLMAAHRCIGCVALLAFDDVGKFFYCAPCRAAADAEVWRRHCAGESMKTISAAVQRSLATVHKTITLMTSEQEATSEFADDDNLPRCKCGLRVDKDHLVCDLYPSASAYANDRRGEFTYPDNG